VQVLVCVYGRGWYQEWGKPAVKLEPGVIIEIPEGVKHWHGAAKDSWMQHLTYHKDVQEDADNELMEQSIANIVSAESRQKSSGTQWLEPVTDEIYLKLK
jgi:cupin superfamily acireductone dioxygenase involved in methionine salvage